MGHRTHHLRRQSRFVMNGLANHELVLNSVLVTGANRGLGLGIVHHLLEQQQASPRFIFATCRCADEQSAKELRNLAEHHASLLVVEMDITDRASVERAVRVVDEAVGEEGLNLLVNNAGTLQTGSLGSLSADSMLQCYHTNAVAPAILTEAFLPLLNRAADFNVKLPMGCQKAAVVNVSSEAGSISSVPGNFHISKVYPYRASKAALNMLIRCLAEELKEQGILCVALHPGWVRTRMGGSRAQIGIEESITGILGVMACLTEKDNGSFLDWRGQTVPW
ncbi:unnamed protein product [Lampetra fluviatilis]